MNVAVVKRLLESSECDRYGYWKANAIMSFMQELAGLHAVMLGMGRAVIVPRHRVAWVIARHDMVVDRYPVIGMPVEGKTFPTTSRRGIYPRFYQVEDEKGQSLVRGSSFWTLAGIESRAMEQVLEVAASVPGNEDQEKPLPYPTGARELEEGREILQQWRPIYTDIDRNGHVNNSRVADWALCFLNECVDLSRRPIHTLQVTFHKEMLQDEEVSLRFLMGKDSFSLRCFRGEQNHVTLSGTLFEDYDVTSLGV